MQTFLIPKSSLNDKIEPKLNETTVKNDYLAMLK